MQADMFIAPEVRPEPTEKPDLGYGLRYYQQEAVEAIQGSFADNDSALLVMATGLGKTQIFCAVADAWSEGRVLILAHRSELIDQAARRIEQMSGGLYRIGEQIGIEQAELRSTRFNRFVVGSVQSCYRESRLAKLRTDGGFGLVIVDEAHHAVATTYRKILDAFPGAKILGVTATPDRADELAMGQVFDDVPFTFDIEDGIDSGYLVPIHGEEIFIEAVNLDRVEKDSKGDLAQGQLDEEMANAMDGVVFELVKRVPPHTRQGIVFTPGVQSAHFAAERLNKVEPGIAMAVDGTTNKDERARLMEDFRAGRIQWLVNCQVATEGFDAPSVEVIAQARPTQSRSLYAQMIGRGTRVFPGTVDGIDGIDGGLDRRNTIAFSDKPHCTIYDFVGNNTKHTLVTPTDLLGGKYTPAEVEMAKKMAKDGERNPRNMLEAARAELRKMAQARAKADVSARSRSFNPFGFSKYSEDDEHRYQTRFGKKPVTPGQHDLLKKYGFSEEQLAAMSRHGASRLIEENIQRAKANLATFSQLKVLQKYGIFERQIQGDRATAAINYIAGKGWGRKGEINPEILNRIVRAREPGEDDE